MTGAFDQGAKKLNAREQNVHDVTFELNKDYS
jgi:hypothetical protein